eukprot:scaffold253_cov243-Pinguiococcus_pyrenoidosus.AAC.5
MPARTSGLALFRKEESRAMGYDPPLDSRRSTTKRELSSSAALAEPVFASASASRVSRTSTRMRSSSRAAPASRTAPSCFASSSCTRIESISS